MGVLTRIGLVRKRVDQGRLDNSHDGREQGKRHHHAHADLSGSPHLEFPEGRHRHDCQHNIGECRPATDKVLEPIEDLRIPACTRDSVVPEDGRRVALEVDNKHRDHGHHDLEDDHAVEKASLERGQREKLVDQDCDGDVGETEGG